MGCYLLMTPINKLATLASKTECAIVRSLEWNSNIEKLLYHPIPLHDMV